MRPKHHYVLHLPSQLRYHGYLVSTMCMERKHRVIKRYLRPRRTLTAFEAGIMEDVTCFELWQLCHKDVLGRAVLAWGGGERCSPEAGNDMTGHDDDIG